MFKAKLITNKEYYKFRSKRLWLILILSIPIAFLANFYVFPIWSIVIILACHLLIVAITARNHKVMDSMIGQSIIEIEKNEIRIKSQQNNSQEAINPRELDKIVVPSEFGIAQETMKDIGDEISGYPKKNYLILHQNNEARKFDFELDSHYMIKQLDKIIEYWSTNELKIERI